MKKSLKRIVSILVSVIMMFSFVQIAFATVVSSGSFYTDYPNKIYWTYFNDGTFSYSGKGEIYDPECFVRDVNANPGIVKVELNNGISSIPSYCFTNYKKLETVSIDTKDLQNIGTSAFAGCSALKSINLPNTITTIPSRAFYECASLSSIDIPSSIERIEEMAFASCTSLRSITIPASVKYIGRYAFQYCTSLYSISVDTNNLNYASDGRALFNKDTTRLIQYALGNSSESYTVPDTVETIGERAFYSDKNLENIVLPIGVTTIESEAFRYCPSLSSITIPYTVNEFGSELFTYKDFVIYGYSDSPAEEYANENNIAFVSLCTHDYISEIEEEPTCTSSGTEKLTCPTCGYSFLRTIPATTSHAFVTYSSDNNATCTNDGTKTAKCEWCDTTNTIIDTGSALGHAFNNYVSDNNATCTSDGTKTAKCERCNVTNTIADTGSALGHVFTNYVSDNNATCTSDGTKTAKCERCDVTNTIADTDSALGHAFTNYVSDNNATCTSDGTKTAKCERCDITNTIVEIGSALGHIDTDNDGICDDCHKPADKTDNPGESDSGKDCSCICHRSGFMKFIYKIISVFWKIFRINKTCNCGVAHY